MDHVETFEREVRDGGSHRGGDAGTVGSLDLEPDSAVALHNQQIELRAGMEAPEVAVALVGPKLPDDLCDGEAFPRSADLRMAQQLVGALDSEQGVEHAGIGDV